MLGVNETVDGESVTYDEVFEILARERRRHAMYCLQQYQTPLALADLADEVALLEHDGQSLPEIPEDEVRRVYLDLYHVHVPKMEATGLLEYDQETDSVRPTADLFGRELRELI